MLFPDFVAIIWRPEPVGSTSKLEAGMGTVLGLPIGAAAMVAGRLVGAVRAWAGLRDGEAGLANPSAAAGGVGRGI